MTLVNAILVIMRARWRVISNTFWRGKLVRKIRTLVLLAVLCFGAWGLYRLSGAVVRWFTNPAFQRALQQAARENPSLPTDFSQIVTALPSTLLFASMIILLFSGFSSLLGELYLSGDIDMLLVAPVPMRAVFVVKFFSALLPQYIVIAFLLAPALLGYGAGLGYGWTFVMSTILVLLMLPLLPASASALLVMAVVRVLPARRARDIVGVLGGILTAGWFVANQFTPEIAPRVADIRNVGALVRLNLPLLPSAWAGRALTAAGEGAWLTLAVYGGLFALLSLSIFALCILLAERLYYAGWSNVAVRGGKTRAQRPVQQRQRGDVWLERLLGAPVAAIVQKDARLFSRDLRTLQQLIFPLAMAGIWTFRLVVSPPRVEGAMAELSALTGLGIAFFLCLTLGNVLAGPGVSREGRSFWLTKIAPVSGKQILLGKLVLAFLPYPTAGVFFLILLAALGQGTALTTLRDTGLLLMIGLGSSAIALSVGAAYPKLIWDTPNQQSNLQTGCLGPVISVFFSGLLIAAVWGSSILAPLLLDLSNSALLALSTLGWLVALLLTALVVLGTLRFGARKLDLLEL